MRCFCEEIPRATCNSVMVESLTTKAASAPPPLRNNVPVPEKANMAPITTVIPIAMPFMFVLKLSNILSSLIVKKAHQRCASKVRENPLGFPSQLLIYCVFQCLTSFEARNISCLNLDFSTSLRISSSTCCTMLN